MKVVAPEVEQSSRLIGGDEQAKAVEEEEAGAATLTFWFGMLLVVSVTMTVGNKVVMLDFHYPNAVTFLQNGTCVVALFLFKILKIADIKPITFEQWKIFAMSAIMLSIQIVTMLCALPLVAIASTVVFRNIGTVVVAIIDYMFFGKTFTPGSVAGLLLTAVGMTVYAMNDINYNFVGYMWLTANLVATVFNTFWNNVFIKEFKNSKKQTAEGISLVTQTETLPIALVLMASNNELASPPLLVELPFTTQVVFFATCIGGLVISVTYSKLFSLSNGTSIILASTVNKAVSIVVGYFVFGTVLDATQVLGLCICMAGGVVYATAGSIDMNTLIECISFWKKEQVQM